MPTAGSGVKELAIDWITFSKITYPLCIKLLTTMSDKLGCTVAVPSVNRSFVFTTALPSGLCVAPGTWLLNGS